MLNLVGEALGGSGNVKLHARLLGVWTLVIVPALLVLVPADGNRGAAVAHVLVLVPGAAGYLLRGARRLGLHALGFVHGLAGLVPVLLSQLGGPLAGFWLIAGAGAPDALARSAGVVVGVAAAVCVLLLRPGPLLEARSLLAAARQRS